MKSGKYIVIAGLMGLMAVSLARAQNTAGNSVAEKTVTFRTTGADDYQSFIGNWDEKKTPVLCAVVRSSDDWDRVFHAAAFGLGKGTQKKPFSPEAKTFDNEQLLVVARVMKSPRDGQWDKVFKVEKVSDSGDVLTLSYRFAEPKSAASFTVKNFLGIFVPKHDYKRITFVENGKTVGTLDLAGGQWSVPTMEK